MASWERKQNLVKSFDSSASSTEEQSRLAAQCILEKAGCFELVPFDAIINGNKGHTDSLSMMATAFDLLLKYATNLLSSKRPHKWRTILVNTGHFKARIDCMNGAREVLKLIGYSEDTQTSMTFPDAVLEPDRQKVSLIAAELLMAKVGVEQMMRGDVLWGGPPVYQWVLPSVHEEKPVMYGERGTRPSYQQLLPSIDEKKYLSFGQDIANPLHGPTNQANPLHGPTNQAQLEGLKQSNPLYSGLRAISPTLATPPPTITPAVPQPSVPVPKPRRNTSFISYARVESTKSSLGGVPQPENTKGQLDHNVPSLLGESSISHLDGHTKRLAEIRAQRELIRKQQSNIAVSCQFPMSKNDALGVMKQTNETSSDMPGNRLGLSSGKGYISGNAATTLVSGNAATPLVSGNAATPLVSGNAATPLVSGNAATPLVSGNTATPLVSGNIPNCSLRSTAPQQPVPKPRARQKSHTSECPSQVSAVSLTMEQLIQAEPVPGKVRARAQRIEEEKESDQVEEKLLAIGYKPADKEDTRLGYKDLLADTFVDKKAARREFLKNKKIKDLQIKAEPIVNYDVVSEEKTHSHRKALETEGNALLQSFVKFVPLGHSPDEIELAMKQCNMHPSQALSAWDQNIKVVQDWVSVYDVQCVVGTPSIAESKRFMLKHCGRLDEAASDCYQDRKNKITSLINKMKPFMEVSWEAATGALSDWDMDVQKAAWALQRDSLGALYEFINSEQEWAKVKQSDMCEIKKLLRGGGWTDNKAPLRLLVGECKFEDTVTANIVVQLMNHWEPVDRDRGIPNPQSYELQFYVNAAKEHRTFEDAKKSLSVDCTICIEDHIVHDMVWMPGCPHSVCKGCFKGHFTQVMKTQSVKHFNCPVCAQPDMTDPQIDTYMYLMKLMQQVKLYTDREVYNLCEQKLRDYNLSKEPNFCWCIDDKCHTGFINDTGRNKIACPICKKEMCFKCKKPWEKAHEGLTCDQFEQWKHDNDPQLQQQGLAAHLEANGIECPACHSRYDLARGGCMHFKCTQCPNEFCSGCGQSFKQQCKRFASCAKRGLHAHHPRDCLFYLRDFSVQELQGFLEKNNIQFDKEPPKAQLEANKDDQEDCKLQKMKCHVMLQKETADGLKDVCCGLETTAGCAGLCEVHYKEYLVGKINRAHLDPISLYSVQQMQAILQREDMKLPAEDEAVEEDEVEEDYVKRLVKYIEEQVPLQRDAR